MSQAAARKRRERERQKRPTGLVLHRGISPGTGDPYVVIATLESRNAKTGNMVTLWIVRDDVNPMQAVERGTGHATCLDCPLVMFGGCYVEVQRAPLAIWKCYKDGGYAEYDPQEHDRMIRGRKVRFGGYGEPVLIPLELVRKWAVVLSVGWTGYTHQWRRREYAGYRSYFMASCHSVAQADLAQSMGWRTFRDCESLEKEPVRRGEFNCPASYEAGERMTCEECLACDGADRPVGELQRASVVIERHANAVQTLMLAKAIRVGAVSFGS
jgi:hypothetical protein